MKRTGFLLSFSLLLTLAGCGDDAPGTSSDDTGTGDTADTGTADEVGESGSSDTTTSDTSTDTSTTTDNCPVGSEGCPCTGGGGCDPGLVCEGGTCVPDAGTTTDTTTDTGTTDTTDTGTTDTTTDTTGMMIDPYGPCPSGDDADCAPGEICITGTQNGNDWSVCTPGECNGDGDCTEPGFPDQGCHDLPGDGQPINYCVPQTCNMMTPCPDGMQCYPGFGMGNPPVCAWPA